MNCSSVVSRGDQFKQGVHVMIKNLLICLFVAGCLCLAGITLADNGPAEMTLQAEKDKAKKPKPAFFPHAKHQEAAQCADCHHGAADGKQVAYSEGMEIQKCESCHYKGAEMPKGLDSFKGAAHKNCKDCHAKVVEEKPELAEKFSKCMPCHPKS
jgi:hypothetical protein